MVRRLYHTELQQKKALIADRSIISIYFGGGTPSQLPLSFYEKIFAWIFQNCNCSSDIEVTIEANPEDLTPKACKEYKNLFNRLSIGVQTLDNTLLKKIGRTHTTNNSIKAIFDAK